MSNTIYNIQLFILNFFNIISLLIFIANLKNSIYNRESIWRCIKYTIYSIVSTVLIISSILLYSIFEDMTITNDLLIIIILNSLFVFATILLIKEWKL